MGFYRYSAQFDDALVVAAAFFFNKMEKGFRLCPRTAHALLLQLKITKV
jgi:hypothetical protein